jgi:hypothetical protein
MERGLTSFEHNLRIICNNFGENWPCSSGEEVENVKFTHRRKTKGNQKCSLEL